MPPHNRPSRPVTSRSLPLLGLASLVFLSGISESAAEPHCYRMKFLPSALEGIAVAAPGGRLIVSVHTGTGEISAAEWKSGGQSGTAGIAGQDRVTRLCFFANPVAGKADTWAKSYGKGGSEALRAITPSGALDCRFEKWVTQVGDKVLPLGLLDISFQGSMPPSGTPLVDGKGEIIGLILQPSSGRSAYAIPAQAVHRVQHDIVKHRKLVRGWMGISLSTGSAIPRITRIWPDSPAAKANLRENDILVRAGSYPTERYPDAVNALFYAVPGEATVIEVMRGEKRLTSTLTPTVQKPGN
ncbi:serine protease [Akkermansiaceae bacterium]|nr:serine protease [Akkermansiaceae bacterium]